MNTLPNPEFLAPGLARRLAAMVYDSLLLMAISILYGAVVTGINVAINGVPATGERISWGALSEIVFVGWLVTIGFFFCYFWHNSGQTLGMKTWRIKVLDSVNHACPTYAQCIVRFLCAPFSACLLGLGYLMIYANSERQTLHDKMSKTRTVLLNKEPQ